ncbi:MAG: hypothetical protein K1X92_08845 [Bacteroidia bacterium]|nr:hypothetical protein [Bacteroidia bacterium]
MKHFHFVTRFFLSVLLIVPVIWSCDSPKEKKSGKLTYHVISDPEHVGPLKVATGVRQDIRSLIHQSLFKNEETGRIEPVLAKEMYVVSPDGLSYTVEIHPDAKWEDGTPVTAKDVLFSLKYFTFPLSESQGGIYMEYLKDFKLYPDNPGKFTIEMKQYYILNDYYLTNFPVLDSRIYDPEKVLENYELSQFINQEAKSFENDQKLKAFAEFSADLKFGRDPAFVKGLGPYVLSSFDPAKSITLIRKDKYWAKGKKGGSFEQFPDTIVFKILKEETAYEQAFINGELDASSDLSTAVFKRLQSNPSVTQNYAFHTGTRNVSASLFFNLKPDGVKHKKILESKNVRKALAYLCPIDDMIQLYLEGYAERIASPVPLSNSQYNRSLTPLPYNAAKADSLLQADGWKDTDGDKILDKVIQGKKEKLSFTITYGKNNRVLVSIVEKLKSDMEKSGILCIPDPVEQNILQDKLFQHDFEAAFVALNPSAPVYDFKQQWHTENWGQKGNFSGFGNAQTDLLIEQIRTTKDKNQFRILSDSMQKIIYNEQPCVFFYNAKGKLIAHNRFGQADSVGYGRHALNRLKLK